MRKRKHATEGRTCRTCCQPLLLGKCVNFIELQDWQIRLQRQKQKWVKCLHVLPNACRLMRVILLLSRLFDAQAFHIFHTSCLIHWILLIEFETWNNWSSNVSTVTGKPMAKLAAIMCPECLGIQIHIVDDREEGLTPSLYEVLYHKIRLPLKILLFHLFTISNWYCSTHLFVLTYFSDVSL